MEPQIQNNTVVQNISPVGIVENTSGHGHASIVPEEIKGWSWGAFGFNWIWGLFNGTYIALLMFIPFVNIVMPFVLGAKGREWAWRNKRWDSIAEFKRIQKIWSTVWLCTFGVLICLALLGIISAIVLAVVGSNH